MRKREVCKAEEGENEREITGRTQKKASETSAFSLGETGKMRSLQASGASRREHRPASSHHPPRHSRSASLDPPDSIHPDEKPSASRPPPAKHAAAPLSPARTDRADKGDAATE